MKLLSVLSVIASLLVTQSRAAEPEVDLGALLDDSALLAKLAPMAKLLPKALPLLQGKVKDKACKQRGKDLAERAKNIADYDGAIELLCELGEDCAMKYVEGGRALLELDMVKKLLALAPEHDVNEYLDMAPLLYTSVCGSDEEEEDQEKEL